MRFKLFEEFSTDFKMIGVERDRFDIPVDRVAMFLNFLYQKVFYEGFDKRHNMFSPEIISKLTSETKSYLLQLKDTVENEGLLRGPQSAFKEEFKRLPQNSDEEIMMISGNIWGGFGRTGGIQTQISQLPVPTPSVISNLMEETMTPQQKQEVVNFYNKSFA
jgi:hypothetical protein